MNKWLSAFMGGCLLVALLGSVWLMLDSSGPLLMKIVFSALGAGMAGLIGCMVGADVRADK